MIYVFPQQDKDVTEATVHIVDLTKRLRDVEMTLKERQTQDSRLRKDLEEKTRCHREAREENTHLKGTMHHIPYYTLRGCGVL